MTLLGWLAFTVIRVTGLMWFHSCLFERREIAVVVVTPLWFSIVYFQYSCCHSQALDYEQLDRFVSVCHCGVGETKGIISAQRMPRSRLRTSFPPCALWYILKRRPCEGLCDRSKMHGSGENRMSRRWVGVSTPSNQLGGRHTTQLPQRKLTSVLRNFLTQEQSDSVSVCFLIQYAAENFYLPAQSYEAMTTFTDMEIVPKRILRSTSTTQGQ